MKVKGFLRDVTGASRVTAARRKLIENGTPVNIYHDPIRETAEELHPAPFEVKCTEIRNAGSTAKTFRFEPLNGKLPPFQAGQYVSFQPKIGNTATTRPFSLSSAPYEARRKENPFFEITVREARANGFVSDYFTEQVKEGNVFTVNMPFGQFFYEPLRDNRQIVALAGGSGITPFVSMAKEISHGTLDAELTILLGNVRTDDIVLKDELDALQSARVHVIHVISDDADYEGEKGFLSADLIRRYSPDECTYFVCGPQAMYDYVKQQLASLGVPLYKVRMEVFGGARDISKAEGYPLNEEKTFRLTVQRGIHEDEIEAKSSEPLAVAMERAGIPNPTRCRGGACGYCRCRLVSGEVFVPAENDGRRYADRKFGYVHACSAYPLSDCTVKIIIE